MESFAKPLGHPIDTYLDGRSNRLHVSEIKERFADTFFIARFVLKKEAHSDKTLRLHRLGISQTLKLHDINYPVEGMSVLKYSEISLPGQNDLVRVVNITDDGLFKDGTMSFKTRSGVHVPIQEGYILPLESELDSEMANENDPRAVHPHNLGNTDMC